MHSTASPAWTRQTSARSPCEVALLGRQGLRINDSDTRDTLRSLPGEFNALNLLCLMHTGVRSFYPSADTGTDLDKEYDVAKDMRGKKS